MQSEALCAYRFSIAHLVVAIREKRETAYSDEKGLQDSVLLRHEIHPGIEKYIYTGSVTTPPGFRFPGQFRTVCGLHEHIACFFRYSDAVYKPAGTCMSGFLPIFHRAVETSECNIASPFLSRIEL